MSGRQKTLAVLGRQMPQKPVTPSLASLVGSRAFTCEATPQCRATPYQWAIKGLAPVEWPIYCRVHAESAGLYRPHP